MQGIPSDEDIAGSVRRVLVSVQRAESQHALGELVRKDLSKNGEEVRLTDARVRRVAAASGATRIEIEYRGSQNRELPDICPVCGNAMSPVTNSTLDGGTAEFKRVCTVCPFSVGMHPHSPGRYVFARAPEHEVSDDARRVRLLKAAASHLRKAKKLIGEALEGTDFPDRKAFASDAIDEIVSSKERAGSIPNLIADVRGDGAGLPLWAEPLSTPKYPPHK
ncbi:MAG: hypothetical protein A3Q59_06725 [Methanomethylophilus alvi]|nr:MAG: hypothetical protein A3Q59_06725 [Methanomethylophilus alvi]